jgi:hypothetical protein
MPPAAQTEVTKHRVERPVLQHEHDDVLDRADFGVFHGLTPFAEPLLATRSARDQTWSFFDTLNQKLTIEQSRPAGHVRQRPKDNCHGGSMADCKPTRCRTGFLLLTCLLALNSCLEDLQAIGPGVRITAPLSTIKVNAGDSAEVFAQVLDANDEGVDGAYVTFTRTDVARIAWSEEPVAGDATSVKTGAGSPFGITGSGVASAPFTVPADAESGEASVVAILKAPARDEDTIAVRITIDVTATGGAGSSGSSNGGGTTGGAAAATGESGQGGEGS